MIIDAHAHLGDILNPGGGALINKQGVKMPHSISFPGLFEAGSMRTYGAGVGLFKLISDVVTPSHLKRVAAATLENMQDSMSRNQVDYTLCMPIAPYVTFDDLLVAHQKDKRVLPFTSADFTRPADINARLQKDIENGARGLKLHPIIQRVPLNSEVVVNTLQFLSSYKLPVLVHTGEFRYYLKKEAHRMVPEFGNPKYLAPLIANFPDINFIVGHSGLFQYDEVIRSLKGRRNVWIDTSFQSPEHIRKLVQAFGENRVLFASDWPYGMVHPSIKTVRKACRGNTELENQILYQNACHLFNLSPTT